MKSVVFILIYLHSLCRIANGCWPCKCKNFGWDGIWTNLITADCRDISTLNQIPQNLDTNIGGLVITGHTLTRFDENEFTRYKQLKIIYAVNNSINSLHKNVFKNKNLIYITLGGNNLTELPTELLHDTPNLVNFFVYKNKITKLQSNLFVNLLLLEELHLNENEISVVEENCFVNLPLLKDVHLQFNLLKTLNLNLDSFPKLETFYLHNNPWHCDDSLCKIINIVNRYKLLNAEKETTCSSPENVNGKQWNQLRIHHFSPSIIPGITNLIEGDNIVLQCHYCFIANITWTLNNRVIANRYHKENQIMSTLKLTNARKEESGKYSCRVENCENCKDASANITVEEFIVPTFAYDLFDYTTNENIFQYEVPADAITSTCTCNIVNILLLFISNAIILRG